MSVDADKKFLLKKVKHLVVGEIDQNLSSSLKYIGFEEFKQSLDTEESLALLKTSFYGFITCTASLSPEECRDFIIKMRGDTESLSRFSPIFVVLDKNLVSKAIIEKIRDAGATEIIVSNFGILQFKEKIFSIIENPRNFIISRGFIGPDRRRKKIDVDAERRKYKNKDK